MFLLPGGRSRWKAEEGWVNVLSAKPLGDGLAHGLHPGTESRGEVDP